MYILQKQKGYSLVEVLVAVSILMLAIVGPMTIAVKSTQSARYVQQQSTAIFLAQEGVSIISAIRNEDVLTDLNGGSGALWGWVNDNNLNSCFSSSGCNIDFSSPTNPTGNVISCSTASNCVLYLDEARVRSPYHVAGSGGSESIFTRQLILTLYGDEVSVRSLVQWQTGFLGGAVQTVEVNTSLFNTYK